ncbi:hypothetical protein [Labrys monachus]|uniref:Uncharacterized protein n=1 Tax=Labrys monachus TaxID=217067 RepID=A0ABU0FAR4_9HYPH|nr:hypothetical protein [Labrys monachus]MDQ0391125.1 hypothetical protein [Labrys monachus]
MKYALLSNGVVDNIAYESFPGYVEASDMVFGGFTQNGDGTFSPPAIPAALLPTLDDVKAECKRRILAVASLEAQSNINGYVNNINAMVATGGTLTTDEHADLLLFNRAMRWIAAMRTACPALVGVADYTADSHWPALDADLAAFAQRF